MKKKNINLHEPTLFGNEIKYVTDSLKTSNFAIGNYLTKFENKISKLVNKKYALSIVNGTSALHIALKILGVNSESEVIVPSITFIAPINAVRYLDAKPVFMDCDNYFNLNVDKLIQFLDEQTYFKDNKTFNIKTKKQIKAIIIVHVFGNAVDLKKLVGVCKKKKIKIIEDSSESLGSYNKLSKTKKVHTGFYADIACFSFNGNKIITAGNGGMILVNNLNLFKQANYLINQAKDDNLRYIHKTIGFNYKLSNINAAIGLAQLEKLPIILHNKQKVRDYYLEIFGDLNKFHIMQTPIHSLSNNWLNVLLYNGIKKDHHVQLLINRLIKKFIKNKIFVRPVWYPCHLQKPYKNFQNYKICNIYQMYQRAICLPSSSFLTKNDIFRIRKILDHE